MTELGQDWRSWVLRSPTALTLGNFDGIHLGHHQVLTRLVAMAQETGLQPTVVTFEPHPRLLFRPDDKFSRLSSPEEKHELLQSYGVQIVTIRFDSALAQTPPETFIRECLVDRLKGQAFLLGHDHRFGAGARGDAESIRQCLPSARVEEAYPFQVGEQTVSSTLIRTFLETGKLREATELIGRPFQYSGWVVKGAGRARQLNVPTANIDSGCPEKIQVFPGVYFGMAHCEGREWPALANIGFAPTFGEGKHKIEVHIPYFSGDLYGRWLQFNLHHLHRPEQAFANPESLKAQIKADLKAFGAFFAGKKRV